MNNSAVSDVADAFLSASLPIDPNAIEDAASRAIAYYETAPASIAIPADEVASRFLEMWRLWLDDDSRLSRELKDVVREAVCIDPCMEKLAGEYFKLIGKLEEKSFMSRSYAIALVGCSPLIRTLVVEQRLGLDRIRSILNVPGATFDAIKSVLGAIGISAAFDLDDIPDIHESDVNDVAALFGDTDPDEAAETFKGLLGVFSRNVALYENVVELVLIGFEPYLFMLYYELLTIEKCDRFPGRAIYECTPRGTKVKKLWNEMYNPDQENPYLNNAKSVYSLDLSWAETKLSNETQNGSLLLADAFDILMELPYTTRRSVAHVIRCYLVLMSSKSQDVTPLPPASPSNVRCFVENVSKANSLTKGVLDQRLVDFLTICVHYGDQWLIRGAGSSVNESNASARKFGDIEFLDIDNKVDMFTYEAHGGGLRDEYVEDHIRSLRGIVDYYKREAANRGDGFERDVKVVYVAHDVSRLDRYADGHTEDILGVRFTFYFITFADLIDRAGGLEFVSGQTALFDEYVHRRISRLPDAYTLKQRYCSLI